MDILIFEVLGVEVLAVVLQCVCVRTGEYATYVSHQAICVDVVGIVFGDRLLFVRLFFSRTPQRKSTLQSRVQSQQGLGPGSTHASLAISRI